MEITQKIQELEAQHVFIHNQLNQIYSDWLRCLNQKNASLDLKNQFEIFFNFLLEDHFKKEEVIFKKLLRAPFLDHGGPRCTHFMALFLSEDTYKRRILLMAPYINETEIKKNLAHFPEWVTENTPLKIPLEEHNWVQIYKIAILSSLEDLIINKDSKKWALADMLIESFVQFLGHHREKEDTCLFELIKSNLNKIT